MVKSRRVVPSSLHGAKLLLVLLKKPNHEQYLVSGVANWTGSDLVVTRPGQPNLTVPALYVERSSFSPEVLPRLVRGDRYGSLVAKISIGIDWCVPVAVVEPPDDAISTPGLLLGLAFGREGEIFLMQSGKADQDRDLKPPFRPLRIAAKRAPLFQRFSAVVRARGMDPDSVLIVEFEPEGVATYVGLLVTRSGNVFQFRYDDDQSRDPSGQLLEWSDITDTWRDMTGKWKTFEYQERLAQTLEYVRD